MIMAQFVAWTFTYTFEASQLIVNYSPTYLDSRRISKTVLKQDKAFDKDFAV